MASIDGGWVRLLEQKTWVFLSLAAASGTVWYLIYLGFLGKSFPYSWIPDAALVACVLFLFLGVGSLLAKIFVGTNSWWRSKKARKAAVDRLNSLSAIEHNILSYLVQSDQRSFNARLDNGDVVLLLQKGLVQRFGGQQSVMEIAHFVPDHIWSALQARRHDFNSADLAGDPPWHRNWMSY